MEFLTIGCFVLFILFFFAAIGAVLLRITRDNDGGATHSARAKASTTSKPAPKYNWLVCRSGPDGGKVFHVGKRLATIGRGVGNFIQIEDENSSRVHAQVKGAASGMQIKDMGSSHGTMVNGELISEETFHSLQQGDEIRIGDTLLVYQKTGDFHDDALRGARNVSASQQKKTAALGAVGGPGGLREQILQAVEDADGDLEKAAEKLGIEAAAIQMMLDQSES